ncbi:hypothetical protein SAMN06298211_101489 [Prevotellaceae bacterium MN60]|nr:hypothetical protein SAMN06298211_101489 [Prevotellaceae bacterium MN60]
MAEIQNRNQLKFYLMADRMMNRGHFRESFLTWFKKHFLPDYIMLYLESMRKTSYYSHQKGLLNRLLGCFWKMKYYRIGIKLGFDIGCDVLGYGCVIGHAGTIVIGESNKIGSYAVLHTSTCIANSGTIIGDGMYLAAGAIITKKVSLGNNIQIGANSLVNKSIESNDVMIGGMPSEIKKNTLAWYQTNGDEYKRRYDEVEKLKIKMCV